MTPAFFRRIPLQIELEGNFQSINFAAGFSKHIDPLSGMTVNLVTVDQWLDSLSQAATQEKFLDAQAFLSWSEKKLKVLAATEAAVLSKVQMQFFDHSILSLGTAKFFFEKSQQYFFQDRQKLKICRLFFQLEFLGDLKKAKNYLLPKELKLAGEQDLKILADNSGLKIMKLEIFDPLLKSSEIILNSV